MAPLMTMCMARSSLQLPEVSEVTYYVVAEDDSSAVTTDPDDAPTTTFTYTVGYETPEIYINEFMASNDVCCTDDYGDNDDWVELYNAESYDVSLSGMYLTDDLTDPTQYMIGDTIIPAGGFIVFWCDDETEQGICHTNFKLGASGEEIGLFDTDAHGNVDIDSLTFGEQDDDVSYGLYPDGVDNWIYFETPTPGSSNIVDYMCGDVNASTGIDIV